ncbi:hypothetical protein BDF22DRAFT_371246 [Syncephalis plumigaleata]|nr:hypothetical protein BDF22DRAFT_371246 [Syncephalis plumigaleata]
MSMKSIPAMLSHHGQASVASSDSLCSNKSDDSSTYHCKRQEASAPSTPPKPRLTFKDTVERRVYVSDCEYSMHLEPLDNALYIRRRKSLRRRTGANGKFITDYDGTTDSDLLMAEEAATSNCHPQNDTIDTASTTLIDTQNDELVVSLSADTLSHLLPQDHLNNNDDDDDDDDDLSSLTIGGCSGWDFEDEEDEEDEQDLEDSDEDLYEESDEDFDNDDIWQDDDLESSSISASSNKQALHGRVNDQQHRNNSSHRHRHRQQQQHHRRRRRRRRNEPSAGQRAAAMAGNIIELINEACDLIHWIASVWLIGYYI